MATDNARYPAPVQQTILQTMLLSSLIQLVTRVQAQLQILSRKKLLHVPDITKNLLLVSEFPKYNQVMFEFYPDCCLMKDLTTSRFFKDIRKEAYTSYECPQVLLLVLPLVLLHSLATTLVLILLEKLVMKKGFKRNEL
ncbi:hypothetical protein J1N35_029291 [Gossypium stocksii]|uniref:Uncharacterized protein n=1 Tax=Gossypium stocksii TaxID=47602 RepID=A0A9D3UYG5_9ROSI|nr:hypothetical protein J1N35_029291 [Gossypium stocksii]